jgi:hypothetical protein
MCLNLNSALVLVFILRYTITLMRKLGLASKLPLVSIFIEQFRPSLTDKALYCKCQMKVFKKSDFMASQQDCQMEYLQTKNPDLGTFCRALKWRMIVYLWLFRLLPSFGNFVVIWYFYPGLVFCA